MNDTTARTITDLLALDQPPVALAFLAEPPADVATVDPAPSSCSFWRLAAQGVFYAKADAHFNCPVGAMVMGFDLPDHVNQSLSGAVQSMCDTGYLTLAEASQIPRVSQASPGILYGPLSELPVPPDLVLLWLTPAQAMLCNEATGNASWTGQPIAVHGRPGCAAVALAQESRLPQMSLGCAGMRFFTGVAEERSLLVLPGGAVEGFVQALQKVKDANLVMLDYYRASKAAFAESTR